MCDVTASYSLTLRVLSSDGHIDLDEFMVVVNEVEKTRFDLEQKAKQCAEEQKRRRQKEAALSAAVVAEQEHMEASKREQQRKEAEEAERKRKAEEEAIELSRRTSAAAVLKLHLRKTLTHTAYRLKLQLRIEGFIVGTNAASSLQLFVRSALAQRAHRHMVMQCKENAAKTFQSRVLRTLARARFVSYPIVVKGLQSVLRRAIPVTGDGPGVLVESRNSVKAASAEVFRMHLRLMGQDPDAYDTELEGQDPDENSQFLNPVLNASSFWVQVRPRDLVSCSLAAGGRMRSKRFGNDAVIVIILKIVGKSV